MATGTIPRYSTDFYVTDHFEKTGVTIAKNANIASDISVAKSGYTPFALIGFQVETAGSGGKNGNYVVVRTAKVDGNVAYVSMRNMNTSEEAIIDYHVKVLYRKN